MIALIMAGGFGTRFWPLSRKRMPKQFLQVSDEHSMIQLSVDRLLPIIPITDIYVVTTADQAELVFQHLPSLPKENVIVEPFGMNTAPCIALSIQYLKQRYAPETPMVVLPADHMIRDDERFREHLITSASAAMTGYLVTFGIVPNYPATGYGYIEAGESILDDCLEVISFKEKPDQATAESFLKTGRFFWNSGIFTWSIKSISAAFAKYSPDISMLCEDITKLWQKQGYDADISSIYRMMPRIPIDIGIMEKATNRVVIPVDIGWTDVGSFKALAEIFPKDENSNSSNSELYAIDSRGNFIRSNKFVALIGMEDICLIETPDAILLTPKDRAEEVKHVVDWLRQEGRNDLL
nr:mannose-phosphate guanylyltransferase [Candidatus Cloacimonadota bacterium]